MDVSYHRHDLSDHAWSLLEPHLPGQKANGAVLPKTIGASSMACFGSCAPALLGATCHPITATGRIPTAAFCRWRDRGQWESLLEILIDDPLPNG